MSEAQLIWKVANPTLISSIYEITLRLNGPGFDASLGSNENGMTQFKKCQPKHQVNRGQQRWA